MDEHERIQALARLDQDLQHWQDVAKADIAREPPRSVAYWTHILNQLWEHDRLPLDENLKDFLVHIGFLTYMRWLLEEAEEHTAM